MAIPETPLTRLEQYLNRIATGDGVIPNVPLTRIEQYLNRIATKDGAIPETPLTRTEQYLNKIATGEGAVPNVPLTRAEQYLAKTAGQDVAVPEVPLTRTEQYLAEIAESGGGVDIPIGVNLFDPTESLYRKGAYIAYSAAVIDTKQYGIQGYNPVSVVKLIYDSRAKFSLTGSYYASTTGVLALDSEGLVRVKVQAASGYNNLQSTVKAYEETTGIKITHILANVKTSDLEAGTVSWVRTE